MAHEARLYEDDGLRDYYFLVLSILEEPGDIFCNDDAMLSRFVHKLYDAQCECRKRGIGLPVLPEHIEALFILEGLYE